MKTKKAILIFSNIFPNPDNENKGIFIKQLTDSLCQYYHVTVVSPVAVNPFALLKSLLKSSYKGKSVKHDNYIIYYPRYLVIPKLFRSLHWLSVLISTYGLVKRLHNKHGFLLISSHWVYPDSAAAVIISKLLGVKSSVHALGCDINDYTQYYIRRRIIIKTLEEADLIVTKSNALKDVINNELSVSKDVKVILNGVNKCIFKPLIREDERVNLDVPVDRKMLLFVGNFQIEKGLEYLLDAFSVALKSIPDLYLYVIGGGPLQSKIENKITGLGIKDNVILLGRVAHHLLPAYFSSANYLCLPSLREGCPNVVIESLSCGTPVIASDVGAVRDIVPSDMSVFIHDAKNIEQMTGCIILAFSEQYIERVEGFDWFTWDDNRDLIYSEFENILSETSEC